MENVKEELYIVKAGKGEYTIPKQNIVMLAMHEALQRGITHGNIHDEVSAIEYLKEVGIEVQSE